MRWGVALERRSDQPINDGFAPLPHAKASFNERLSDWRLNQVRWLTASVAQTVIFCLGLLALVGAAFDWSASWSKAHAQAISAPASLEDALSEEWQGIDERRARFAASEIARRQSIVLASRQPQQIIIRRAVADVNVSAASQVAINTGAAVREAAMRAAGLAPQPISLRVPGASDPSGRLAFNREVACLTEAIYFEARGEPFSGQVAVAEVVRNRVLDPRWPSTYCGVVYQGLDRAPLCQFSYACDGIADIVRNRQKWSVASGIAAAIVAGYPSNISRGADHYHADYVGPSWARRMYRTATIGRHLFFKAQPGDRG